MQWQNQELKSGARFYAKLIWKILNNINNQINICNWLNWHNILQKCCGKLWLMFL